ncbi:MAG: hypothetical protein Q7K26_00165 [bacterium]|nr:hypothetical protein [bacterium]
MLIMSRESIPKINESSLRLQELIKRHENLSSIPNNELTEIGYERSSSGALTKLGEADKYEDRRNEKEKNVPFGEIGIILPMKKTQGRRLGGQELQKFQEMLTDLEDNSSAAGRGGIKNNSDVIPQNNPFHLLESEFPEFLDSFEQFPTDEKDELQRLIFHWHSVYIMDTGTTDFFNKTKLHDGFLGEYTKTEDADYELSSADSLKLFNKFEKMKGVFADTTNFEKKFRALTTNCPFPDIKGGDEREEIMSIIAYAKENKITTYEDILKHLFILFLEKKGIGDTADKFKNTTSIDDVRELLKNEQNEIPVELRINEKKLKDELRDATEIEAKQKLNEQIKNIKEQIKYRKRILQGMYSFYTMPSLASEYFERNIKHLQDFLIRKNLGVEKTNFYLDARLNKILDADPGDISGDCTEGKPLPFNRPDIPIYNVKVFSYKREHIGNAYLLITKEEKEVSGKNRKTWHFDAIQIPSTIDWDSGIANFISGLAIEAEKKEIDLITVNTAKEHISNYDYIQNAVENFWKKHGRKKTKVSIPKVIDTEKYSEFQGDGNALVLWEKIVSK